MWFFPAISLVLFPELLAFARAHPYITAALVLYVVIMLIAWLVSGDRSSGGGYSSSSYTSSMHDARSDAQSRTRDASNDYLRKVRDTTRR